MYFSSCNISESQESASLTVLKRGSALYWLHNDSLYTKGFYCSLYLFTHMLSLTREGPYLIMGNKGKCQTCSLNFASFFCTETQPSFVIRWWYPHSCWQWHDEDLSDSWIKDTKWKVMVILWYWTLYHFNTQRLQSSHLDWWYFLYCGNDFWQIYTDFFVKIWQVKVKLRVWWFYLLRIALFTTNTYQSQSYRHNRLDVQDFHPRCIKLTKYKCHW